MLDLLPERCFTGEIRLNLFSIGVVIGQGRMYLGKAEVPIASRNFFGSKAHLVPRRDAHHGHTGPRDFGPSGSYFGIAVDQCANLDGGRHA
jgi:hypothetical protein